MRFAVLALLSGCTQPKPPAPLAQVTPPAPSVVEERCAMVDAVFALESFRTFACGTASTEGGKTLVDLHANPPFPATASCPSSIFAIYRKDQPTNTNALLTLYLGTNDNQQWRFTAEFIDPPNSPDDVPAPDGGFDDANYYCGFIGTLEHTESGWRASSG